MVAVIGSSRNWLRSLRAAFANDLRPGLAWLVRLRWVAVVGQLVATAVALWMLEAPLSLPWLLTLIGVTAATNIGLGLGARTLLAEPAPGQRTRSDRIVLAVLVLDTALLTGLLLASGGAMNPFSIFFIVQVALAGLLVGAGGAWSMAGLTSLGFALLFLLAPDEPHAHHNHGASPLHLRGMWVAYALAAAFVAMFVSGIATALRRRERELAALRERALQTEQLAALSAFSAGAAHELGTPLSTIAIVSNDLGHALDALANASEAPTINAATLSALADDARVMRTEVERCRVLLRDLSERSGTWAGETPECVTLAEVTRAVIESLSVAQRGWVDLLSNEPMLEVFAPRRSLVQSLANIVRNAMEADTKHDSRVTLEVTKSPASVIFKVLDRGAGFPSEVLARIGEPFVTTKPTGAGLGLGLHLAYSFAATIGGAVHIARRSGGGSEVTLSVPRATKEAATE